MQKSLHIHQIRDRKGQPVSLHLGRSAFLVYCLSFIAELRRIMHESERIRIPVRGALGRFTRGPAGQAGLNVQDIAPRATTDGMSASDKRHVACIRRTSRCCPALIISSRSQAPNAPPLALSPVVIGELARATSWSSGMILASGARGHGFDYPQTRDEDPVGARCIFFLLLLSSN